MGWFRGAGGVMGRMRGVRKKNLSIDSKTLPFLSLWTAAAFQ
jgi:hypothetical protein